MILFFVCFLGRTGSIIMGRLSCRGCGRDETSSGGGLRRGDFWKLRSRVFVFGRIFGFYLVFVV